MNLMLEAMIEIGEKILRDQDIIESRIKDVSIQDKKGQVRYVAKLNFDIENNSFKVDLEEADSNSVKRYIHLGRDGGPNANQWYVTFTGLNALIAEVVSQLAKMDLPDLVIENLNNVLDNFYYDFGEKITPKYRYMLDINKLGISSEQLPALLQEYQNENKPYKSLLDQLQKELQKYIESKYEIKSNQIALYTLAINGEPIASTPWYKKLLEEKFKEGGEEKKQKVDRLIDQATCSFCGSNNNVTSDLRKMNIKYYTTNQNIFASNFDKKNYSKNMVLCQKCYDSLLTSETFIQNQMKARISKLDVYIIPHIVFSTYELTKGDLYYVSDKLIQSINMANNIEHVETYKNELLDLTSNLGEDNYILINIVFYKKMNQATKILKLIKDVNPSILDLIAESVNRTQLWINDYYSEGVANRKMQKGMNLVYYMTPIKLSQQSPAQYQKVLNIYESIFYHRKLNKRLILKNVIDTLKICWFEQPEYNVSGSDSKKYIDFKIMDALFYVGFLEKMGNLERGEGMDITKLNLKDQYISYIEEINYDEQQTALFLLGCMVGAIGRKQNNRNNKSGGNKDSGTYKPILNKLNFNGMELSKIKRLSNEIPSKMRQEKILIFYERVYQNQKYLLDLNEKNWNYNKDENLYYLLSGYAYETMRKFEKEEKVSE